MQKQAASFLGRAHRGTASRGGARIDVTRGRLPPHMAAQSWKKNLLFGWTAKRYDPIVTAPGGVTRRGNNGAVRGSMIWAKCSNDLAVQNVV